MKVKQIGKEEFLFLKLSHPFEENKVYNWRIKVVDPYYIYIGNQWSDHGIKMFWGKVIEVYLYDDRMLALSALGEVIEFHTRDEDSKSYNLIINLANSEENLHS